jgi:pimeloyl-ACP methyl ester carboxylesterase
MNRARRRGSAALWAVLLAATGIALSGTPATAAATPGLVLTSYTATLPAELSPLATGKRISYVTTSVSGSTTTATGLVLTPKTGKNNKTVVWGHGTTGLADVCAPSTNQGVFWPEARTAIAALLAKGFTVTAPDYPGLGSAGAHPYLIGASEGRSMIDSVKAARRLDSALTVYYAVDGHSQGGQGALFTGELAPSYDGSLVLRGVSAIAPVSNVDLFAPVIPGTAEQGYLVMGLYGLQAVDSAVVPNTYLAPTAKTKTSVLQTACLNEILAAYAPLTATQLLVGGALPDAVVTELAHYDNPAQVAPSAPILLVQGTDDEAVPYDITAGPLLDELNAYDQPVLFVPVEGATHDSSVTETATLVANWLATQLA